MNKIKEYIEKIFEEIKLIDEKENKKSWVLKLNYKFIFCSQSR